LLNLASVQMCGPDALQLGAMGFRMVTLSPLLSLATILVSTHVSRFSVENLAGLNLANIAA